MTIKWAKGETEALVNLRGKGAKGERENLFNEDDARVFRVELPEGVRKYLPDTHPNYIEVNVAGQYKHLGSIIESGGA